MKINNLILFLMGVLLSISCTDKSNKTTEKALPSVSNDSMQIAITLHGFFEWYTAFQSDTMRNINFTDDSGKHLKIKEKALKAYLGEFNKSGFVSENFITNEFDFYKKCEKLWQNEEKGDVASGMDADKMLCAQDGDPALWTKSPVRIVKINEEKVKATMYGKDESGGDFERQYELIKQNRKWLIDKVECDLGVK